MYDMMGKTEFRCFEIFDVVDGDVLAGMCPAGSALTEVGDRAQ